MSELKELRMQALRKAAIEKSEADKYSPSNPDFGAELSNTEPSSLPDPGAIAAGVIQDTTLEHGDEILESIGMDKAAAWLEKKRVESPGSYYGAQILNPLNPVSKIKKLGTIGKGIAIGAGYGHGISEEEMGSGERFKDTAVGGTLGGAIGTAMKIGGKGMNMMFGEPSHKEMMMLGTTKQTLKELRARGFKGVKEASSRVSDLSKKGLFTGKNAEFDPIKNKFVKKGGISNMGNPSLKEIQRRKDIAVKKASKEVERILESKGPTEDMPMFNDTVVDVKGRYPKETIRDFQNGRLQEMQAHLETVHIDESVKINDEIESFLERMDQKSLLDFHGEKKRLYKSLEGEYGASKSNAVKETRKELARLAKDFVNEKSGSKKVSDLNETMENLYTFSDDIDKYIDDTLFTGTSVDKYAPYGSTGYIASKALNAAGEPTRLSRAKIGRGTEHVPQGIKDYSSNATSMAPTKMMSQEFIDRDEYVTREPQGQISGSPHIENLPLELVQTPLPRNSSEWINQKQFVLAKIAQEAPDLLDSVRNIIERQPEDLPDLISGASQAYPHLFVKDQYGRIDGKIVDPINRETATKDTMRRDDLDSQQKAVIIQLLNTTGEFND